MRAYYRGNIGEFCVASRDEVLGRLQAAYSRDGYSSLFTSATRSWSEGLALLQEEFARLSAGCAEASAWTVLLEYPLYRLRRRIDVVLLAGPVVIVIEVKVGSVEFTANDKRQVEEYALDLNDFHSGSGGRLIVPLLWCTRAPSSTNAPLATTSGAAPVQLVGAHALCSVLEPFCCTGGESIDGESWDSASYRPVPTIVQAATAIFSGHRVDELSRADASNLAVASTRVCEIIESARRSDEKALVFLTGVPGAGKTLAGLQIVHDVGIDRGQNAGEAVYLSGNTPLVIVLREALARDCAFKASSSNAGSLREARRRAKTRIQHINDFLRDGEKSDQAPHDHAIVFDEAQRTWDARHGKKKFDRDLSEASLLLSLMGRHADWCACICLVGGGQEINSGEEGVAGWGIALKLLPPEEASRWRVYAPTSVFEGGVSTGNQVIGTLPSSVAAVRDDDLELSVPVRTYRSPSVSRWVDMVLEGNDSEAARIAQELGEYPIVLTRCLSSLRDWLRAETRGERRCGLVASSGARRLRADGLGAMLHATAGDDIAHWYLNARDDIRASYSLEVPANEYTSQGLELDRVGVCWGGDMLWESKERGWVFRRLNGDKWQHVRSETGRRFSRNSYRVLMTRAREGIAVWVPTGDLNDSTRSPTGLDGTASFLLRCGAKLLTPWTHAQGTP